MMEHEDDYLQAKERSLEQIFSSRSMILCISVVYVIHFLEFCCSGSSLKPNIDYEGSILVKT
jgi:hypothetical protein